MVSPFPKGVEVWTYISLQVQQVKNGVCRMLVNVVCMIRVKVEDEIGDD